MDVCHVKIIEYINSRSNHNSVKVLDYVLRWLYIYNTYYACMCNI